MVNWTQIHWSSWSDFWAMGGYGFYVWGSMTVTFALLAIEVWQARRAHARTLAEVAERQGPGGLGMMKMNGINT